MSEMANWSRWLQASICKHFDDNVDLPMFVEGDPRATKDEVDFFEVRIDGPDIRLLNPNYWRLDVSINILIQSTINNADTHKIHKQIGLVMDEFDHSINVYRYGVASEGNDDSLLGCLYMIDDPLDVKHFGQLEPRLMLMQASIEGKYTMNIRGT